MILLQFDGEVARYSSVSYAIIERKCFSGNGTEWTCNGHNARAL